MMNSITVRPVCTESFRPGLSLVLNRMHIKKLKLSLD